MNYTVCESSLILESVCQVSAAIATKGSSLHQQTKKGLKIIIYSGSRARTSKATLFSCSANLA